MKNILTALSLVSMLAAAPAHSAPQKITDGYAKRLAQKAVKQQGWGRFPYKVTLDKPMAGTKRLFTARVNWGNRPHIMIAVPDYRGSIDMKKSSPKKGLDRVSVFTRGNQPNQ